jgi:hypothetical protein
MSEPVGQSDEESLAIVGDRGLKDGDRSLADATRSLDRLRDATRPRGRAGSAGPRTWNRMSSSRATRLAADEIAIAAATPSTPHNGISTASAGMIASHEISSARLPRPGRPLRS